jgi:flagellar protein FlaG
MENRVALSAPLSEPDPTHSIKPVAEVATRAPQPAVAEQPQADLRLVIEEVGNTGSFVYKTVDRRTGQVVNQLPREEVVKLRESETYSAGAVIKAQA